MAKKAGPGSTQILFFRSPRGGTVQSLLACRREKENSEKREEVKSGLLQGRERAQYRNTKRGRRKTSVVGAGSRGSLGYQESKKKKGRLLKKGAG